MTRSMAAGLSPDGIRVNALCPGFVATPQQDVFMSDPEQRDAIAQLHRMGIMDPEDIAAFAVFLDSDEAKRLTGGVHVADSVYTAFMGGIDLANVMKR